MVAWECADVTLGFALDYRRNPFLLFARTYISLSVFIMFMQNAIHVKYMVSMILLLLLFLALFS